MSPARPARQGCLLSTPARSGPSLLIGSGHPFTDPLPAYFSSALQLDSISLFPPSDGSLLLTYLLPLHSGLSPAPLWPPPRPCLPSSGCLLRFGMHLGRRRLQADPPAVDWRGRLLPEARRRIVNKIMETLKRHSPISVPEGLNELHKIAVRFEEKVYSAATSLGDYLKKISLKMLSMESRAHPAPSINSGMSAGAVQPQNPGDPALSIPPQVSNQAQSLINQSSMRQALLPQNLQNNTSADVPTGRSVAMEGNSWRPAQGDPTTATAAAAISGADPSAVDWRGQLLPEARQRIVNKIMETLKRHSPISVPEGLNELHKIAVRFEEKIYSAATSQEDYVKKISVKLLSMESKAHPA